MEGIDPSITLEPKHAPVPAEGPAKAEPLHAVTPPATTIPPATTSAQTAVKDPESTSGRRYNTRSATSGTRKPQGGGVESETSKETTPKKPPRSNGKAKQSAAASSSKRTIDEVDADEAEEDDPPVSPLRRASTRARRGTNKKGDQPNPPVYSFLEASLAKGRTRAVLPVPVPNLTKKSRGRRVPTGGDGDSDRGDEPSPPRTYVCSVEGCNKCFHRGEHLKRHIRSIHTHEKPFKCSFTGCNKFFNRHDNLLQHLKVHKDPDAVDAERGTPSVQHHKHHHRGSGDDDYATGSSSDNNQPRLPFPPASLLQPSYVPYYPPLAGTSVFTTNMAVSSLRTDMAVSSLRTELPRSPPQNTQSLPPVDTTFPYNFSHDHMQQQNIRQQQYERMHHQLELEGGHLQHLDDNKNNAVCSNGGDHNSNNANNDTNSLQPNYNSNDHHNNHDPNQHRENHFGPFMAHLNGQAVNEHLNGQHVNGQPHNSSNNSDNMGNIDGNNMGVSPHHHHHQSNGAHDLGLQNFSQLSHDQHHEQHLPPPHGEHQQQQQDDHERQNQQQFHDQQQTSMPLLRQISAQDWHS